MIAMPAPCGRQLIGDKNASCRELKCGGVVESHHRIRHSAALTSTTHMVHLLLSVTASRILWVDHQSIEHSPM